MADIEQLTDEERAELECRDDFPRTWVTDKALRIIDAQAAVIERARKMLEVPRPVDSPEARLARELWEVLGG